MSKREQTEQKLIEALRSSREQVRPSPILLSRVLEQMEIKPRFSLVPFFTWRKSPAFAALFALILFVVAGTTSGFRANKEVNNVVFAMEVDTAEVEGDLEASKLMMEQQSLSVEIDLLP